ncbi:hypothetical protein DDI_1215 [Dickeya dianthicola RNS04.9]|nr:hypothetical protein DDI_1215 [Dickeya dianthicola RNS04.9]
MCLRAMAPYPHMSAARNSFLFFSEINMKPFTGDKTEIG